MSRPLISIFNIQTQEEIIRELNDEEYAQHLIDKAAGEQQVAEHAAQQAEKEAAKVFTRCNSCNLANYEEVDQ